MRQDTISTIRSFWTIIFPVMILILILSLGANWRCPSSGFWHDGMNWESQSCFAFCGSPNPCPIPTSSEAVNFTQPATYSVFFSGNAISGPLGIDNGSNATFNLNGFAYDVIFGSPSFLVANGQVGSLTVLGGILNTQDGMIPRSAGGEGLLTIGTGATWNSAGGVSVGSGSAAIGSLTVHNGGLVTISDSPGSGGLTIGQSGGSGMLTVTGPGSSLIVSSCLSVGNSGSGTISNNNGASITSGCLRLNSTGNVTVSGSGSSMTTTGDAGSDFVNGGSTILIEAGAAFSTTGVFELPANNGISGTVMIDNATWTAVDAVPPINVPYTVGALGTGTLSITSSTNNSSASFDRDVFIGRFGSGGAGDGIVNVDGLLSSMSVAGTINIGVVPPGFPLGSEGFLNLTNGGSVSANSIVVGISGTISGSGTINSSITNDGTTSPGNSIGAMTVDGNYTQAASGSLNIECDSLGHDLLIVTGIGNIASLSGTLGISFLGGFVPSTGSTFVVLTAPSISGIFSNVVIADGIGVNVSYLPDRVTVEVTFVPCPADITPAGGNGTVNIDDLVAVLNAFGTCPAPPASCDADITPPGGNGAVNIDDLLAVLNGFGACP